MPSRSPRPLFVAILVVYALLAILFAARTPAWQAPDEPAHYNYIQQVRDGMLVPVIQQGDWDSAYLNQLKSERFAPETLDRLADVEYEDHQPPLYYWLSAPVFLLTNGNLFTLRLLSIAWGLVTLIMTFRIARLVFPTRENVALGAMALVAFLPQHLMILSSVNNDALAGAVLSYLLYLCLRYRLFADVTPTRLGVMLGVVIFTKTTIYFMAAVIVLAVVLRWLATKDAWTHSQYAMGATLDENGKRMVVTKSPLPLLWQPLLMIAIIAGLFALAWFGRNINVYGFPDILGLRAHDAIVVGQPRTSDLIARVGFGNYVGQLVTTTFQSYWGQFGWMAVPMINVFAEGEALPYGWVGVVLLLASAGLFAGYPTVGSKVVITSEQRDVRRILLSVLALSILVFAYYNTQFVQFQGRYLFSALIPFGIYVLAGLEALFVRLRQPRLLFIVLAIFALLDFYLIWRVLPGALG